MNIVFMGTPEFAIPSLNRLLEEGHQVAAVITQPDRPKGRGKERKPPPVKEAALKKGLCVLQPENIREAKWVEQIQSVEPKLIVTVAYGQILPKDILDIPQKGCLNVHASLLPAYRGAAAIHWAIINGERETGVTIMMMDEGMDTGDMIVQEKIPITTKDTVGTLHDKLADLGADLLIQAIELIQLDQFAGISQDHSRATYAPLLKRKHEKIDWTKSAREIVNLIRGMNPWPGAYTIFRQKNLKIYEADIYTGEGQGIIAREDPPGTVVRIIKKKGFVVLCGIGYVLVKKVKLENSRAMTADDFLRGSRLEEGERLGNDS